MEISEADAGQLVEQGLARHQHAVAIRITAHYYPDADSAGRRVRKRLRPVFLPLPKHTG